MALCNVREKILCVFETEVVTECTSSKRPNQSYKVLASSNHLRPVACDALNPAFSIASEKLDGTCCLVKQFKGRPWLWARHDRKPTKSADKRFRTFTKTVVNDAAFVWNLGSDFKEVPPDWIAADSDVPDAGGHIPGWVPIDLKSRVHCWHLSAVDLEDTCLALVIRPRHSSGCLELELAVERLEDLVDCTMELVGTNVNANPYKIGSRNSPIHFLTRHGVIQFTDFNPSPDDFINWFSKEDGQVEGIVWHCKNGQMFKLHRHHLGLDWPVERPRLLSLPVTVNFDSAIIAHNEHAEFGGNKLLQQLNEISGRRFNSLADLSFENT